MGAWKRGPEHQVKTRRKLGIGGRVAIVCATARMLAGPGLFASPSCDC